MSQYHDHILWSQEITSHLLRAKDYMKTCLYMWYHSQVSEIEIQYKQLDVTSISKQYITGHTVYMRTFFLAPENTFIYRADFLPCYWDRGFSENSPVDLFIDLCTLHSERLTGGRTGEAGLRFGELGASVWASATSAALSTQPFSVPYFSSAFWLKWCTVLCLVDAMMSPTWGWNLIWSPLSPS